MIADDNSVERSYLKEFLTKQFAHDFTVIAEARDGAEVLELTSKQKADLYLLDIQMPKLTGLEAAEQLLKIQPDAVIFFITSYADFSYVRQALRLGVVDYLLKPYDDGELAEILGKILGKLDRKTTITLENPQEKIQEYQLYALRYLLNRILIEHDSWLTFRHLLPLQRQRLDAYKVVLFYPCEHSTSSNQLGIILKTFFCKRNLHCLLTFRAEEVFVLLYGDQVRDFQDLEASIQRARSFLFHLAQQEVYSSVSAFHIEDNSIETAYKEAASLLTDYSPAEISGSYQTYTTTQATQFQTEKTMLHALLSRRSEAFRTYLEQYLDTYPRSEEPYLLYLFVHQVYETVGKKQESERVLQTYLTKLESIQDSEKRKTFIRDTAETCSKEMGNGGAYHNVLLVRKAIKRIQQSFRQKLTLQEIAEELEVSYSHLSKCFKEVTDSSFNDYLLQVRMQEADVLLSSTSLGIAEVGKQVGIDDPYYFSKSFKKYAKVNPRDFVAMKKLSKQQ